MSSLFRESAVKSLSGAGEDRPRVQLVPPRRWLVAVALVVMVVAGVVFAAIATTRAPVRGVGYLDQGGFITLDSAVDGLVQDGIAVPGTQVKPGDVVARVLSLDGTTTRVVAPGPGTVMQLLGPAGGWPVKVGAPLLVIAGTGRHGGPNVTLLLPGVEATELTEGSVSEGASAWLEPAGKDPIACVIRTVRPYAQPADSIAAYMPDPFVKSYVQEQGSIQVAEADCPADSLRQFLPGTALPVTVEINPRSPLDFVFGTGG
jgi:hypothetical protein